MGDANDMQQALQRKSQDRPDEERMFVGGMGKLRIYNVGGSVVGMGRFEPGWRWSQHVKPIAGTESCQAQHTGYVISGTMCVRMDDGEQVEYHAGDSFYMRPGHDAWVVGDEACELLDFTGAANYAVPHQHGTGAQSTDQASRNKQLIMAGYEEFGRKDIDALLNRYTDDVEWIGFDVPGVPFSGAWHGKDGVRDFFSRLAASMDVLRFEPKTVIAEGDRVVVLGQARWLVRSTGREVASDWTHVFQLREGKVCRFQNFSDTAQMAEAFRLEPQAGLSMRPGTTAGTGLHS